MIEWRTGAGWPIGRFEFRGRQHRLGAARMVFRARVAILRSNPLPSPFTCVQVQPLRVGESPSVQRTIRGPRERVHPDELALVHHRLAHAARLWYSAEVSETKKTRRKTSLSNVMFISLYLRVVFTFVRSIVPFDSSYKHYYYETNERFKENNDSRNVVNHL